MEVIFTQRNIDIMIVRHQKTYQKIPKNVLDIIT